MKMWRLRSSCRNTSLSCPQMRRRWTQVNVSLPALVRVTSAACVISSSPSSLLQRAHRALPTTHRNQDWPSPGHECSSGWSRVVSWGQLRWPQTNRNPGYLFWDTELSSGEQCVEGLPPCFSLSPTELPQAVTARGAMCEGLFYEFFPWGNRNKCQRRCQWQTQVWVYRSLNWGINGCIWLMGTWVAPKQPSPLTISPSVNDSSHGCIDGVSFS